MAQSGTYIDELESELKQTPADSHSNRLLTQEITRLTKGEDEKKERTHNPFLELHTEKPQRCSVKIRIPVKEYPKYNFVGKLLGPKGSTLKALQDQTGCKMAVMGRGSMREKDKEEECRKQGGKYAHLNDDLHVLIECFANIIEGHHRIAAAMVEVKKFLIPADEEMYGSGDMGMNGAPTRGRGGYRGGPSDRGRGSFRGRGNGHIPPPARGAPAGRGMPRGGPAPRGAPAVRGRPAPPTQSYDSYSQGYSDYNTGGYDTSYTDSYGQDASSYYDYSQSASTGGYDSYSGGYGDYSDGWSAGASTGAGGKTAAVSSRGSSRGAPARSHPYSRPGATGTY